MKRALAFVTAALCALAAFSCAHGGAEQSAQPQSAPEHEHSYSVSVVAPTCTAEGYTQHRCSCGDEYKTDIIPATGHEYSVTETVEPTCTEAGSVISVCTRCQKTRTETTPPLGHELADPKRELSKEENGYALYETGVCSRCGGTETELVCRVSRAITASRTDPSPCMEGGGTVDARFSNDGSLTLYATPHQNMDFVCWSDGSTELRRNYSGTGELYALFAFKGELPVINVVTDDGEGVYSRNSYSSCTISVIGSDGWDLYDLPASIRVRGNASSMYGDEEWIKHNKVHYRIKFDSRTPMLGLNGGAACKNWVLLRGDGCYLKETIPFYLFRNLCDEYVFCPDITYAKLFVNGQYMGLYEVCDQIQIDKYRINIPEEHDGGTEIATGYLMELENYPGTASYYFGMNFDGVTLTDMYGVKKQARHANVSVKYDVMSREQLDYLSKYMNNVYRIVYRAVFYGDYNKLNAVCDIVPAPEFTSAGECIANVINLDSAAAMYIIEELAMNKDVGVGSFFMYTDLTQENPVLTFCAPWDFSWAFSDDMGFDIDHFWVSAWQPQEFIDYAGNRSSTWYITLYQCEEFREIVKEKWRRIRSDGTFDSLLELLPQFSQTYTKDIEMERKRWSTGNPAKSAANIAEYLKKRAAWLDTQWGN